MAGIRPQPYRIDGEPNSQKMQNIDEMFQMVFEDLLALDESVDTLEESISETPTPTPVTIIPPIFGSADDGRDGMSIVGPMGPAGLPGFGVPWPGTDGEDGMFGPPGAQGAAGSGGGGGSAVIQTTTATGTQNDFALTTGCTLLRCNNASLVTFTGFSAGTDGQVLQVVSLGAGQVDFSPQNASSSAANRLLNTVTSIVTSLAAGTGTATYVYDGTTARWRLTAHNQGTYISVAYASGDYTATGGGNSWTVDSGDMTTNVYFLNGRKLTHVGVLEATSIGGAPVFLLAATPFSTAIVGVAWGLGFVYDNSTTLVTLTTCQAHFSIGTSIRLFKPDQAAFQVSTNNTYVRWFIEYEIG